MGRSVHYITYIGTFSREGHPHFRGLDYIGYTAHLLSLTSEHYPEEVRLPEGRKDEIRQATPQRVIRPLIQSVLHQATATDY